MEAEEAATTFLTPAACAASSTLKLPSHITPSASRGSAAQAVIRRVAMWITASIPAVTLCIVSTSRMSPRTRLTRGSFSALVDVVQRAAVEVVDDHDLRRRVVAQQQVDGGGAHEAAAAGDQDFRAVDFHSRSLKTIPFMFPVLQCRTAMGRAGLPATTAPSGTSRVTLLPSPISARAPMARPFFTLVPLPM